MEFGPQRTFVLFTVSLLALLPLAVTAESKTDMAPSKPVSVEPWVGPGTLVHSSEKHQRCEAGQFELFSCALQSGGFIAVCLSDTDLHKSELEFRDKKDHYEKRPFDYLGVGVEPGGAHGYNMVLRGHTSSTTTTIFASSGAYEGESGAISRTFKSNETTSYCVSKDIYVPALLIKDKNGNERLLNKNMLITYGIAKRINEIPDWPEISDDNLTQKPK